MASFPIVPWLPSLRFVSVSSVPAQPHAPRRLSALLVVLARRLRGSFVSLRAAPSWGLHQSIQGKRDAPVRWDRGGVFLSAQAFHFQV